LRRLTFSVPVEIKIREFSFEGTPVSKENCGREDSALIWFLDELTEVITEIVAGGLTSPKKLTPPGRNRLSIGNLRSLIFVNENNGFHLSIIHIHL
jgi:hypothetical protein